MHSLQHIPSIIFSSSTGDRLKVNLFPVALSHVGDEEVSRCAIKSTTPRISNAVSPDLIEPRSTYKRIVRWYCIIAVRVAWEIVSIDIHAQYFT